MAIRGYFYGHICNRKRKCFGAVTVILLTISIASYTVLFMAHFDTIKTKPKSPEFKGQSSLTTEPSVVTTTVTPKKKLILLWTPFYGKNSISGWFGSNEDSFWADCPYSCKFTMDKSLYNSSDALVVDGLAGDPLPPDHNLVNQIWIFFRIESPAHYHHINWSSYENKFNWTMSYRRDSDILWPAARFRRISIKHPVKHKIPTLESLKNKTAMIAWVVSNCHTPSQRSNYVDILKKYVQVDMYGKCGPLKCEEADCYQELSSKYKFWLAFENSICADYVSEKIHNATRAGIVPIVYAHPSFLEVTIPGSYINVYDFKTAQDLSEYLKHLDANPKEYLKYFDWVKKYEYETFNETERTTWCNVCTKLNTIDFEKDKDKKWYSNIREWYHQSNTNKDLCYVPQFDEEGKFSVAV